MDNNYIKWRVIVIIVATITLKNHCTEEKTTCHKLTELDGCYETDVYCIHAINVV